MQPSFVASVNSASLLERKQRQLTEGTARGRVKGYDQQALARELGAAIVGSVSIAFGLLGPGWRSIGQGFVNMMVGLAVRGRLQSGPYTQAKLAAIAEYLQLFTPHPIVFPAWLGTIGEEVEDKLFPVLAEASYTRAGLACRMARSRVVS